MFKYNEPLGMPRGSVRALLTLVMTAPVPVLVVLACFGKGLDSEILAFYAAIVMLVLKDYFGSRQVETHEAVTRDEPPTTAVG